MANLLHHIKPSYQTCLAIANALYGDQQRIDFSERYLPENQKFENPKVLDAAKYLFEDDSIIHFWSVMDDSSAKEIGYILITNLPHHNAIGYSIDVNYANQGIMKKALKSMLNQIVELNIKLPLHVYTNKNNLPSIKLLKSLKFNFVEIVEDPPGIEEEFKLGTLKHFAWT